MTRLLHASSLRFAVAVWLATILALFVVFLIQLEPAQWAGITVWIVFMQSPRLNYSKIVWWVFGTVVGALVAIILIALFHQAPDLFFLALACWLSVCAAAAALVRSYRAYGAVLAGYTCAIVSISAAENPNLVFQLAMTRVSCIFVGMASAMVVMAVLLPPHRHWHDTVHHLGEYLKATLQQVGHALCPRLAESSLGWQHVVDRLSTLEHTLDVTTAETPESRLRSDQARSLVATLSCVLAKAQSTEVRLTRAEPASLLLRALLTQAASVVQKLAGDVAPGQAEAQTEAACRTLAGLHGEARALRAGAEPRDRFLLARLEEIFEELHQALQDWAGLFGPWKARRPSCVAEHRDFPTAFLHALRMLVAVGLAVAIWHITQWPSGAQLVLFICVVSSLLSLQERAPDMGFAFLKSALFCATAAYVDAFWLFQKGEGFPVLALVLGLFLLPAAYAYRHPRLIGSAVVSMLIFYGLALPANQMNYDISAFSNNALALLGAATCGFFAFHVVPTLTPRARRTLLLRAMRADLMRADLGSGFLSEQRWTVRLFDRLRLLHRANSQLPPEERRSPQESEMLVGLQLGLRQIRLRELLGEKEMSRLAATEVGAVFRAFRQLSRHPEHVSLSLRAACARLREEPGLACESQLQAIAEMEEMSLLVDAPGLPCAA